MVYFVGAGTGAPDLITVRGMRLLEQADVIIYAGSLVNPELLSYAGPDCTVYNSAEMTLEQVLDVMEQAAARGLEVVRLLAQGRKYEEVAAALGISLNTVKYHIKNLLSKTGHRNVLQLVVDVVEKKLVLPKF